MKVRGSRRILSEADICDFFETTKNFGKRFYTIQYSSNSNKEGPIYRAIDIEAIAVSRDLIYKIVWTIGCKKVEGSPFPKEYRPERDWHLGWFFNQFREQDEKPCVMNAFDYRGFVEMDTIEEV